MRSFDQQNNNKIKSTNKQLIYVKMQIEHQIFIILLDIGAVCSLKVECRLDELEIDKMQLCEEQNQNKQLKNQENSLISQKERANNSSKDEKDTKGCIDVEAEIQKAKYPSEVANVAEVCTKVDADIKMVVHLSKNYTNAKNCRNVEAEIQMEVNSSKDANGAKVCKTVDANTIIAIYSSKDANVCNEVASNTKIVIYPSEDANVYNEVAVNIKDAIYPSEMANVGSSVMANINNKKLGLKNKITDSMSRKRWVRSKGRNNLNCNKWFDTIINLEQLVLQRICQVLAKFIIDEFKTLLTGKYISYLF